MMMREGGGDLLVAETENHTLDRQRRKFYSLDLALAGKLRLF
jgi:hypothetical protein